MTPAKHVRKSIQSAPVVITDGNSYQKYMFVKWFCSNAKRVISQKETSVMNATKHVPHVIKIMVNVQAVSLVNN